MTTNIIRKQLNLDGKI